MSAFEEAMTPWGEQVFRDYVDFIDRVARPMVEADGDEEKTAEALALYRLQSPYGMCISMVMLMGRVERAEAAVAEMAAQAEAPEQVWDAGYRIGHLDGSEAGYGAGSSASRSRANPFRTQAPPEDHRPHSRACGIRPHPHGTWCHSNCPTCHGESENEKQDR